MKSEIQIQSRRSARCLIGLALFLSFILHPSSFLRADSVFIQTLEVKNVTIRELKGDTLSYEVNGRMTERPVARISRIIVTSEAPLNAAEEAFATEKWDVAVDGYQKVIRTTAKPWVKDWAMMRLIDAANKSNRFDAAAAAYILMLLKNPTNAATSKPAMPDAKSTFLTSAVNDVNISLADSKLTTDQKRALIGFLIELQQARKDTAGEDAAYEMLAKLPGADANDPNTKRVVARRRLSLAQRDLDARNYQDAITEIDGNRAVFVDPTHQIEALYILAQARYGLAGNDLAALKDAGLAYMRVVTLAKNDPNKTHVVDSLIKTAGIMEQLGQPQVAMQMYQQIVAQYPDDPAAQVAANNYDRLKVSPTTTTTN